MKVLALSALLLVMLVAVSAQDSTAPCFPCDPNWPRAYYYPNYDDCGTVWECKDGALTKTSCDAGFVFEFLLQACVEDTTNMMFTCSKLVHRT